MRILGLLVILLVGFAASAAEPYFGLLPRPGAYWNSAEGGTGWVIDVGNGGAYVFASFYVYDAQGRPTFYTLQGEFVPTTEAQREATGEIGRVHSPVYITTGGPCLGCPYIAPSTAVSSFGEADLVWYSTQRADFVWSGGRSALTRFLMIDSHSIAEKAFEGTWRGSRITTSGSAPNVTASETDLSQLRFKKRTTQVNLRAAAGAESLLPTADEVQYEIEQVSGFGLLNNGNELYLLNTKTGAMRSLVYCTAQGAGCVSVVTLPGGGQGFQYTILPGFPVTTFQIVNDDRILQRRVDTASGGGFYQEVLLTKYTSGLPVPAL